MLCNNVRLTSSRKNSSFVLDPAGRDARAMFPAMLIKESIIVNLNVAETAMGKPLFKASDGGQIDILREGEDVTQGELQQGSRT